MTRGCFHEILLLLRWQTIGLCERAGASFHEEATGMHVENCCNRMQEIHIV
jgi:hypothetical protein